MSDLKRALDASGHCVLEMPSGTGKTVSLLALIVSYQQFYPTKRKLIYCSRTVPEIEKALSELKRLLAYRVKRAEQDGDVEQKAKELAYTGLGLTSRKNLCLHPEVSKEKKGRVVDARCRDLTNAAAIERAKSDPDNTPLCSFHDTLGELEAGHLIPPGIHTLADVISYGKQHGTCPYFTVRRMMPFVDVIIYSFHYLLDPKVAEQVSKEMSKDAIVVFDEAHNIGRNYFRLRRPTPNDTSCLVRQCLHRVFEHRSYAPNARRRRPKRRIKLKDASKLQEEYAKLVEGLQEAEAAAEDDAVMANPALPDDLLHEAIPGNIRKAEHFVAFLKRFVEYLKTRMRVLHVVAETPLSFLQHLKDITYIERRPLRFCTERLQSLVRTLELSRLDEYSSLQKVAAFATLVATYEKGFLLILEPFETEGATIPNPIFHLTCLDPAIAIRPVFERFSSVVITSGTISPLDMYPKMLQFTPVVITRGSDQVAISSRFEVRNDPAVGILNQVWQNKLIFVETPDANETSIALENYRRACDNGRGAVLLSVARGKVSEGIDFDHNYGRAVIMFGIPYQYTESRILKARLEYLRDAYRIRESEFLGFDAMRNAAQCVGRVLRGKTDWGLMIFADKRFARADKRSKLPRWINQYITESASNLSTDMALVLSKMFMRTISQNPNENPTGVSLWTLEDVLAAQEKQKTALAAIQATVDRGEHGNAEGMELDNDEDDEDEFGHGGLTDAMLAAVDIATVPG
ncbi:hypothetical protein FRB99_004206 [Tulasnella sp. 403]|nr:hypothetical protein FRB99_004206 [Tulasnella sp. 403]